MIEFTDVSLELGGKMILKNLSFHITEEETVLLTGSSGVGKSTILKLILGLIKPSSGEIRIRGQEITRLSESELLKIRHHCGIVFQEGALFDSLTIEENVSFFLRESLQLNKNLAMVRVIEILRYLGLENFRKYYPSQLSGGMKKRVAIARAIISNPNILLYDEPTAGLDIDTAWRVVDLIQDLRTNYQITSIIISHEVHYFLDRVDRLMILRNGELIYNGPPDWQMFPYHPKSESNPIIKKDIKFHAAL